MKLYRYHPVSLEYIGEGDATPDPMNEGEWLIPAGATTKEVIPPVSGQLIKFIDGDWVYAPVEVTLEERKNDLVSKRLTQAPDTLFGGPTLKEILYDN